MLNAIGAGLIGAGAILLVTTLTAPTVTGGTVAEFERTSRNSRIATALSITATAVGATLILVNHDWPGALIGLGIGATVYYVAQVGLTWRTGRAFAAQVELERLRIDGRVTLETAARIGLLPTAHSAPFAVPHALAIEDAGEQAADLTRTRSRLRWALRHPRGGNQPVGL